MAANDEGLSEAMVRAAKDLGAMLYVLSRSKNYETAKRAGVPVCGEVFADRGYSDDGTLAPRDKPGGMIEDSAKAVKQALGSSGRDMNFNAYADQRSLFRYDMHTLPSEISDSIGTSTLFAAWNAATYVAQIEDERLAAAVNDGRYIAATREVLQKRGGLWFHDESYVISRRRD
jgi:hypothetical protein